MQSLTASLDTFLVGYDGTERSEPAVVAALELAKGFHAIVDVVHAVPVPSSLWAGVDAARQSAASAEALGNAWKHLREPVHALLERCGYRERPVDDVLRVMPGQPAQVLLEQAAETGADIVFLGRHHKRGLFDFGSTARALLAGVRRALWVQPGEFRPIRRVLVPVDLSEESLAALAQACVLARALGARVDALHCFPPPDFAYAQGLVYPAPEPTYVFDQARDATRAEFEAAMAKFDWQGVEHSLDFQVGDPAAIVLERQSQVDLIAMGTHGRTGLSAAVLGNVAYGVLKQAEVPVLALRHPERRWLAG